MQLGQFLAEQFPFLSVVDGQVQGAACGGNTEGADDEALAGEFAHQVHEALAFFTQQRGGGDAHVGEEEFRGVAGVLADFVEVAAFAVAGQRGVDQEQADATGAGLGVGFGSDDDHVGVLAVGDEGFGAVEDVVVPVFHRAGADGLEVAAGAGFGHGDGAHGFAGDHFRQPVLALFFVADMAKVRGDDVGVHHDVGGQGAEAHAGHFFAHDDGVQEGRAAAAPVFRYVHTQHAGVAQGVPEFPGYDAGVFPFFIVGRYFGFQGLDDGLPEHVEFFFINSAGHGCLPSVISVALIG